MSSLEASIWEAFISLAIVTFFLGIYVPVAFRIDKYVRKKGYKSSLRGMAVIIAFLMAVVLGFYFDRLSSDSCWDCSPSENPEYYQPDLLWEHAKRFGLNFFIGITLGMVAIAGIAWAVPRRARRFGVRRVRVPWKVISYLWLALIPVMLFAVWIWDLGGHLAFRLFVICCGGYASSSYLARRLLSKGIKQSLQDDTRPPVLYLRTFDREDESFIYLSYEECHSLGVPVENFSTWEHPLTFEEFFKPEINKCIGPFIALGNPYDNIPPGGAEREYFHDENWKNEFKALALQSRFIWMRPERSNNLLFELQFIRDSSLLNRLFIFTRPVPAHYYIPKSWSEHWQKKAWKKFACDMQNLGIHVGDYPGRGAVLSFDHEGNSMLVTTKSRTPEEYIAATLKWCSKRSESFVRIV